MHAESTGAPTPRDPRLYPKTHRAALAEGTADPRIPLEGRELADARLIFAEGFADVAWDVHENGIYGENAGRLFAHIDLAPALYGTTTPGLPVNLTPGDAQTLRNAADEVVDRRRDSLKDEIDHSGSAGPDAEILAGHQRAIIMANTLIERLATWGVYGTDEGSGD